MAESLVEIGLAAEAEKIDVPILVAQDEDSRSDGQCQALVGITESDSHRIQLLILPSE